MKYITLIFTDIFCSIWLSAWFFHIGTDNPQTWFQWGAIVSGAWAIVAGIVVAAYILADYND
jgi:hypothetical protein